MARMRHLWLGAAVLIGVGVLFVAMPSRSGIPATMSAIDPSRVKLEPAPIRRDWIIDGQPTTLAAEIARTEDESTRVYVWQTTAARFHWNYEADEVVSVLDGEVFVADADNGLEHRLGPGDIAFFPAGARTLWRVPDHLRKMATLRRPLPGPIANVVAAMRGVKHWLHPTSTAFAAD